MSWLLLLEGLYICASDLRCICDALSIWPTVGDIESSEYPYLAMESAIGVQSALKLEIVILGAFPTRPLHWQLCGGQISPAQSPRICIWTCPIHANDDRRAEKEARSEGRQHAVPR